jgi:cyclopropane fatty-acyl-phospholipid synthase-like methyltransferase
MDYRTRIYEDYASRFQGIKQEFDAVAAERAGKVWDYYFRGWLPERIDASILDIACGSGKLLHFLKQHGYTNVIGVDISSEQVQIARQALTNVIQANALGYLEANPGKFDLITGLDFIEHLKKDEALRFLDGCHAALKSNGRLILQTPNAASPWGNSLRYGDFTHETGFDTNSLSHLLSLCGFMGIKVREAGPVRWGYSIKSTIRYYMWQLIRCPLKLYNLIETGESGSGIFTRVFLITAEKSDEEGNSD